MKEKKDGNKFAPNHLCHHTIDPDSGPRACIEIWTELMYLEDIHMFYLHLDELQM